MSMYIPFYTEKGCHVVPQFKGQDIRHSQLYYVIAKLVRMLGHFLKKRGRRKGVESACQLSGAVQDFRRHQDVYKKRQRVCM